METHDFNQQDYPVLLKFGADFKSTQFQRNYIKVREVFDRANQGRSHGRMEVGVLLMLAAGVQLGTPLAVPKSKAKPKAAPKPVEV